MAIEPVVVEAGALSSTEFDALMTPLGPFEPAPRIAVGVSGGADSMALSLLLHDWVRMNGGSLTALTVDHGLREGSAKEAAETGRRLAERGIEHVVLRWEDEKPPSGVQAAARSARLSLLSAWCARQGVLHLALAHHAADQAETLIQRLWSGSGLDGLAAMAPQRELTHCRLLRPLIAVVPERLRSTLRKAGLPWVEDPSNDDTRFGRVQARRFLAQQPKPRDTLRAAAEACAALAGWRSVMDQGCAELAARTCCLHPLGYAELDPQALLAAPPRLAERLLRGLFQSIGGTAYAMSAEEAEAALCWIGAGRRGEVFAAGRCQLTAADADGERLVLCRETRDLPHLSCRDEGPWRWDGRFMLHRKIQTDTRPLAVVPGHRMARQRQLAAHPIAGRARMNLRVLATLPWVEGEQEEPLLADLEGAALPSAIKSLRIAARFRPQEPATPGPFYGCLGRGADTI